MVGISFIGIVFYRRERRERREARRLAEIWRQKNSWGRGNDAMDGVLAEEGFDGRWLAVVGRGFNPRFTGR